MLRKTTKRQKIHFKNYMNKFKIMSSSIEWPFRKVRQTFIDYFVKEHQSVFVRSSPVVPLNDPSLLFTNAGMNQFKPIFLGQLDPSSQLVGVKRACNSQTCIRAGGKHNDLEDVGKDVYHHTFFEMLGNWSFGDFFKAEAIAWAWELLTEIYKLPKDRLYATYFGGDPANGLEPDDEARDIWRKFLPAERVLPFPAKENFWEMGETGPCGPCSEIHFDRIGNRDASKLVNKDDPNVMEIWNLVFMQYNREVDKSLHKLPSRHVDTGMGFERLTSILQGKNSNYDTDIFQPIFEAISKLSQVRPYEGKIGVEDPDNIDMAYRVVADHIRTLCFAISDGAVPSGTGRGYVLRRILRRGVRYGSQILGIKEKGFFAKLAPVVIDEMKDAFPLLEKRKSFIEEVLLDEEESFNKTLDKGLKKFNKEVKRLQSEGKQVFPGEMAFYLYGTLGFPVDLTELMAQEKGMTLDMERYNKELEESKELSQAHQKNLLEGKELHLQAEQTDFLQKSGVATTNDSDKYIWNIKPSADIVAIYTTKGFTDSPINSDSGMVGIILSNTSFYSTSGGQVADKGELKNNDSNSKFTVINVLSFGGYVVHIGTMKNGEMKKGDKITCHCDYTLRNLIAPNHTMTHVMNLAIRKVVSSDCDQKGSLVDEEKLRFDFNNKSGLTPDQIKQIEDIVNEKIQNKLSVYTEVVELSKARQIKGLRAVFGETYPDPVRVVSVGIPVAELLSNPNNEDWMNVSIEFCGGTHLDNTNKAKAFAIVEEGSIAKGIRRITAYTGDRATEAIHVGENLEILVKEAESINDLTLKSKVKDLTSQLNASVTSASVKARLRDQLKKLEKKVAEMQKKQLQALMEKNMNNAKNIATECKEKSTPFTVVELDNGLDSSSCNKIIETMTKEAPNTSFMIVTVDPEKGTVGFYSAVCKEHEDKKFSAVDWMKKAASVCGGKGGGKTKLAQGQAKDISKYHEAMDVAVSYAKEQLSQ